MIEENSEWTMLKTKKTIHWYRGKVLVTDWLIAFSSVDLNHVGHRETFAWRSWNTRSKCRIPSNSFKHSLGTKVNPVNWEEQIRFSHTQWLIDVHRRLSLCRIKVIQHIIDCFLQWACFQWNYNGNLKKRSIYYQTIPPKLF